MEHPIIFSGEMVRAVLKGQKTQTRRVINPQPPQDSLWDEPWHGFICVSWLTMEGGCRGEARIFGGTDTDTE